MNILVFDTETTSLEKPFCYNVGYLIYDTTNNEVLKKVDYVVDQIWHNLELFSTAYYAEKRSVYVTAMRARKTLLRKYGNIMNSIANDIEEYRVTDAYAYNSGFDERVFEFNCDWFKCANPLDLVTVHDIRGYVHRSIAFTEGYQQFCDNYQRYTEAGNYSTTAETVTQYLRADPKFIEDHTALSDSIIECEILVECVRRGLEYGKDYKVYQSIPRGTLKEFQIVDAEGEIHKYYYTSKRAFDDPFGTGIRFTIKQ